MLFCGVDNGTSGSIAFIDNTGSVLSHIKTPVIRCLNYTKTKAWINRLDFNKTKNHLLSFKEKDTIKCAIERPMVNPGRFKATVSALRCLEATQLVLEELAIPYEFVDSKQWQKVLLPAGLDKGETKTASDEVCKRMFPDVVLKKSGDGDSLLIAEYLRRNNQ